MDFIDCVPTVTNEEIDKALKTLKPAKAAGPDQIPSALIKTARGPITPVLQKLFNDCLQERCFPSI